MTYFYISFATVEGFRGATVVAADTAGGALNEATLRGVNPGGEAAIISLPPHLENTSDFINMRNRLVTKEELLANGGTNLRDMSGPMQEKFRDLSETVCQDCNEVHKK